jgi:NADPH oxidase
MLMSGEMSEEKGRQLTRKERFDVWMVNEGYRRLFVFTFAILHVMVFVFGMMNYGLKVGINELTQERSLIFHRITQLAHERNSD